MASPINVTSSQPSLEACQDKLKDIKARLGDVTCIESITNEKTRKEILSLDLGIREELGNLTTKIASIRNSKLQRADVSSGASESTLKSLETAVRDCHDMLVARRKQIYDPSRINTTSEPQEEAGISEAQQDSGVRNIFKKVFSWMPGFGSQTVDTPAKASVYSATADVPTGNTSTLQDEEDVDPFEEVTLSASERAAAADLDASLGKTDWSLVDETDWSHVDEYERILFRNNIKENMLLLDGKKLKALPKSIGDLHDLTGVSLRNNQLTSLPDSIGQLHKTMWLDLYNNQLTSLPDSISSLKNLTRVNFSTNLLKTLPESIGDLKSLTYLSIAANQLETLPDSIGQLENLTTLYCSNNQLKTFPDSIGQLENLTELNFAENPIESIPESFRHLKKLQKVLLSSGNGDIVKRIKELCPHCQVFYRFGLPGFYVCQQV